MRILFTVLFVAQAWSVLPAPASAAAVAPHEQDAASPGASLEGAPALAEAPIAEGVATDNVEVITLVTYIFFVYLLLALFVERVVEVLTAAFNYVELKRNAFAFWDAKAEGLRARLERLYALQGPGAVRAKNALDWVYWHVVTEPAFPGGTRVVSADLVRLQYVRLGTRLFAFFISLLLVWALYAWTSTPQAKGFNLVRMVGEFFAFTFPGGRVVEALTRNTTLSLLVSAAAVSVGVEPLHRLIAKVETLKPKPSTSGGVA